MINDSLASQIVSLLSSAKQRVVIVSAFIRSETLKSLFKEIAPDVEILIYARWRFSDIVARASNMEVIDVANDMSAVFKVHNALHAKIYIADDRALLGSANVTHTGLGIGASSNLEILTEVSADLPEIKNVLSRLEKESVFPRRFTEQFLENMKNIPVSHSEEIANEEDNWLPSSLPEALLATKEMPDEEIPGKIMRDYWALGIVDVITEKNLQKIVIQRRIFSELYDALCKDKYDEMNDIRCISFLSENFSVGTEEAKEKWEILKKWINQFSTNMYITPSSQPPGDALRRGKRYAKN